MHVSCTIHVLNTNSPNDYRRWTQTSQDTVRMLGEGKKLSSGAGLVSSGLGTETQVHWLHHLRALSHTTWHALKSLKELIKTDSRANP